MKRLIHDGDGKLLIKLQIFELIYFDELLELYDQLQSFEKI
jgi:hypothetical protein